MIKLFHYLGLGDSVPDLVVVNQLLLRHGLHGVDFPAVPLANLKHFAERALVKDLNDFEVAEFQSLFNFFRLLIDDCCPFSLFDISTRVMTRGDSIYSCWRVLKGHIFIVLNQV